MLINLKINLESNVNKNMKYSKKIILISSLILMIFPLFLIPRTAVAQEWTYDGINTEKIPEFSVYPSEWYFWNYSAKAGWIRGEIPPEIYSGIEVIKGNITDTFMGSSAPTNGTSVYADLWMINATSGEKSFAPGTNSTFQLNWWNGSYAYATNMLAIIIPVADDGKVSEHILNNVTFLFDGWFVSWEINFEHNATYYNKYSFHYWNSSYNNGYLIANFTDDGILKLLEHTCMNFEMPNITLISEPAQEAPDFDITTEHDTLTVNSTEFKLNITITDADNNNNGEIDTDYLYRIQNGITWTDWATPPDLLDWDLGDVEAGNYTITMEVKNMYGVTQKEETIEYVPPKKKSPVIPGYNLLLITLFTIITSAIIVRKRRKKL